ncbi:MAG: NAD-dependent epimerase/dehydratase family protein [Rhizobiaceae bacterium]
MNRVGKVVLTSSIVTLPTVKPGAPLADQTSWRTDLSVPYMRAKTEAEKFAWKLAEEKNTNLATVLTCVIIGPNFGGGTPTTDMIQVMKMGSMRMGTIDNIYQILDVREVVTAHILAAKKDVTGNFIVGADNEPVFVEVLDAMRRIDPKVPKAMMIVPKLFYPKLPAFDWLSNKMMGTPRTMTRELIESIGDTNMLANNQKAKDEFGWSQNVDLETSLRE